MSFPLAEVDHFEGKTCLTTAIPVGNDHVDKLQKHKSYIHMIVRELIDCNGQSKPEKVNDIHTSKE